MSPSGSVAGRTVFVGLFFDAEPLIGREVFAANEWVTGSVVTNFEATRAAECPSGEPSGHVHDIALMFVNSKVSSGTANGNREIPTP